MSSDGPDAGREVAVVAAPDRLRVGLLTREYPPEVYGGAGVHVEYLAAHLRRIEGIDVEVRCFGAPRHAPEVAATYEPWPALPSAAEGAALGALSVDLRMAADLGGVDIVHSHTWYANLGGHLAALAWDIPHVVTCHSLEPLRPWKAEQLRGGYAISSWAERVALESADAVVAVSAGMRDDVVAALPDVDPDRIRVIHNGIDAAEYAPDPRTDTLRRLGIDRDRPYVMFVGRITRQKGIGHLLDAAERLDPAAALVLCAGAPDTPQLGADIRARVEALAARRSGIHWIEEMLPRPDVVQLLGHAAVFVCPSVYEPFGLINVEAMACATPVVASAVGGIPEIVVDGVTGTLVGFAPGDDAYGSPADPQTFAADLAGALDALLADPVRASEMGRRGRDRVLRHFTWEAIAAQTAALYRELHNR